MQCQRGNVVATNKNNNPVSYSTHNSPYKAKRSLKISLRGMKEGDFTIVFGCSEHSNEYLPAAAVKQILPIIESLVTSDLFLFQTIF